MTTVHAFLFFTHSFPSSGYEQVADLSCKVLCQKQGRIERSKLKFLVPSVGTFFTPLALVDAFFAQDKKRAISSRRFVAPVRNTSRMPLDIELIAVVFQ